MIKTCVMGIKIDGIACAVPKHIQDIDDYREMFGSDTVDKFKSMVGVRQRRVASEKQTSSDLAYIAAEYLIKEKQLCREKIGGVVFVTQTPDYIMPSTACVLANRLGLSKECIAFDVNLGCSGYVYGLNIISSMMNSSNIQECLLLVGDTSNKVIAPNDRSSGMLFGDSGSATLLVKTSANEKIVGSFRTDGTGFKAIIMPAGAFRNRGMSKERTTWSVDEGVRSDYDLYMNGTDVFSFTISEVPKLLSEFMQEHLQTPDDYDAFVMHQANCFILKQVAKKAKIPFTKIPISMDRYGNTSVTSIPLTLCDAYAGKKMGKLHTMLCGFGIGLSWGAIDTSIESEVLYPIIESDEYYTDGGVSHD